MIRTGFKPAGIYKSRPRCCWITVSLTTVTVLTATAGSLVLLKPFRFAQDTPELSSNQACSFETGIPTTPSGQYKLSSGWSYSGKPSELVHNATCWTTMQPLPELVPDGSLIPGLCHWSTGYYFVPVKAALTMFFFLCSFSLQQTPHDDFIHFIHREEGLTCQGDSALSHQVPSRWGDKVYRGRNRIALKSHRCCWTNGTPSLHCPTEELNLEMERWGVERTGKGGTNSLRFLPSIIKRSKVLSVLDFFWLSALGSWRLLFPR